MSNSNNNNLDEIYKQLEKSKYKYQDEKASLFNKLENLKSEEEILNMNIFYFENVLKNLEENTTTNF